MDRLKMFDLSGKVALITGGASGLGVVFGGALAEAGADVVLADIVVGMRKDDGTLLEQAALDEVSKFADSTKVQAVKCDVTDPTSVQAMIDQVIGEYGKLDIIVNSAGLFGDNLRVSDMTPQNWDKVLAVDLKGTMICSAAAVKVMRDQGYGKIVNIASASSFKAITGMSAYSAAKSGVVMLTKTLAVENARYNIQANVLSPGYFITPLNRDFFASEAGERMMKQWPGRRCGELEELRGVIIYLCSAASDFTNGEEIVVDGGQWL
jgi:NAD(P)-dependent dehydrogenase (short-subunit alcohol dehydrogenase family)